MYCISTSSGARATFRHHARAEEALQYSSLIATEGLKELLKPAGTVPLNIFRCGEIDCDATRSLPRPLLGPRSLPLPITLHHYHYTLITKHGTALAH